MNSEGTVVFFICFIFCGELCASENYVYRDTKLGTLKGIVKTARNGNNYHAFLGVPYAKPPLGELRWKEPQPASTWEGVRDATANAALCMQEAIHNPGDNGVNGSEDCLYVNVFVNPKSVDGEPKQTLVWFHGGAFIFGGIDLYGADYVMEHPDVILVTVQYRLNAFGFMSTEDEVLPGNYGSLDQVEALRWVQNNIKSFGGDSGEVTVFGMSAGGASVHYLTMSPLTRYLYKNAISLSGSALCWWASIPNPKKQAIELGEYFECPLEDSHKMIECLKQVSALDLMKAQGKLFFEWHPGKTEREPMNMFSPRSDPERTTNPFLPYEPYIVMKEGFFNPQSHVLGYADKEGIWRANNILPSDENNIPIWKDFVDKYDTAAPLAYGLINGHTEDVETINEKLKDFYGLKDLHDLDDSKVHGFIDAQTDSMFNYAIDETVKLRSRHKNVNTYYFMYTYPGTHTLANLDNNGSLRRPELQPLKLASHGTDMLHIFKMFPHEEAGIFMTEDDLEFSRKFIRFLIDFSKSGRGESVNKDWKSFEEDNPVYLLMDKEFVAKEELPMEKRMKFWKSLPPVYWRYNTESVMAKDEL